MNKTIEVTGAELSILLEAVTFLAIENKDEDGFRHIVDLQKKVLKVLMDDQPKAPTYAEGVMPNRRGGFFHIHSGEHECGQAYRSHSLTTVENNWERCSKLVNHKGSCGYANNTAF